MFRLIKNLFRIIFLILMIGVAVVCYAKYIEPHLLQEKHVTITSDKLDSRAEHLQIAVFGDTHFGEYYSTDDFDMVLTAIRKMKPDIVFFTGDLIDHYDLYPDDVGKISEKLAQIEAPYGKFAVLGNHDRDLGIAIIGIDDVVIGYGDPSIASWGRPDSFNIVLSHAPDVIDQILDYNVDLMISGHTHGRQINIKYFDEYILPAYGRKYIHGLYQFSNERSSQLYVNAGIGMTKLPFRFLSPPELTRITLEK